MRNNHLSSLGAPTTRRTFVRQALCAAVGTAALTNTIRDLRFINAALAQSSGITDYKALVCIFLNGGNDANNLFIPTVPAEYANYATIRTPVLAIPNTDGSGASALALNSQSSDGHSYGIHPACPELQALFNAGKMAPVFNVGTLVYPVTKAQYLANSVPLPPQLFSHADQQVQWQTSVPDQPPTTGWGGRCADLLDAYNPHNGNSAVLSMCVTLAGANTFEVGGTVQQYSVSSGGVVSLNTNLGPSAAQAARTTALNNILGIDAVQQNMLTSNYALGNTQVGATTFASLFPTTVNVPNGGGSFTSSLMSQLKMVAQIIEAGYRSANAAKPGLGMKRQVFFVQVGGYDLHTGQTSNAGSTTINNAKVVIGAQANLFAELSQSINAFQNAMTQIGTTYGDPTFDQRVTSFTVSDFGRTFPSNSLGTSPPSQAPTTATTALAPTPGMVPPAPPTAPSPLAFDPASAQSEAASINALKVRRMVTDYHTLNGENPVGTNAEIMAAVMGKNSRQAVLGPPEGISLNSKGELVDEWGTPYFFHQLSKDVMEIHSAGPDKTMGTADDIVVR